MLQVIINQERVDHIILSYSKEARAQRLGQYFINSISTPVCFPELFYECDNDKAWELIEQNFKIIP